MPDRDSYAPGTPSWIDIGSSDLDKTHAFYTSLFGWEREDAGPPEVTGGYGFYMQRDRMVAGYGPAQDPNGGVWWTTYVSVESADAAAVTFAANGGSVLAPPMDVMEAGRMAVLQDPEGGTIAVWQPGEHKGAQIVNEPGAFSWSELNTRDLPKAIAFYTTALGWGEKNGGDTEYAEFTVDDKVIAGGMTMSDMVPPEVPPYWNVYFGTDDVDASAEKVTALGGTVLVPPFDIPDVGRAAVCMGPLGETFSLFKM